jgi:hypothetical protein
VNDHMYHAAIDGVGEPPAVNRWRRRAALSAVLTLVVVASTLSATPAHAADSVDAAGVEQVLRDAGVVADTAAAPAIASSDAALPGVASPGRAMPDAVARDVAAGPVSTGAVSLKTGLTVPSGRHTVRVTPVAGGAAKALSPSGLAVYAHTPDSAYALSSAATGGNAGYAVISGADAPTEYRFMFTVDGRPAVLTTTEGGGIEVHDGSGAFVNSIVPAWAVDAAGAAVETSYSVSGNILTQSVAHEGAAYPVIADPRLRCDGLWCTNELSRAETRQLAANALSPGIACRFLGPGASVCAVVIIGAWAQANIALANGQCIGVRVWQANLISHPHLAYIRCYA